MKKVITILTILVVLVGAVFADTTNSEDAKTANGTAKIIVTAKIPEDIPQFQLKITSADTVIAAAADSVNYGTYTSSTTTTGEGENAVTTTTYSHTAGDIDAAYAAFASDSIDALTTANSSVEVAFDINQVHPASLKAAYSITVTATDLVLKKNSDGTPLTTTANANQKFKVDDTANTTEGASPKVTAVSTSINGLTLANGSTNNVLKVTYAGTHKVGVDSATTALKLGDFKVKWLANTSAVAGDYEATVQMVIASI